MNLKSNMFGGQMLYLQWSDSILF